MGAMRKVVRRSTGAIGIALTTYDMWRRLPPMYRKQAIALARRHGPPLARYVQQQFKEYRRGQRPEP